MFHDHICGCFKFKTSPFLCLNVEFCLSLCYGTWTRTCTFQYRPWTGSIKPSLQHFKFCRVGLSLGILFFSILFCAYKCVLGRSGGPFYMFYMRPYDVFSTFSGHVLCLYSVYFQGIIKMCITCSIYDSLLSNEAIDWSIDEWIQ
jgi:hypothetical protein